MHPNMAMIRSRVNKPGTSDRHGKMMERGPQELSLSGQVVIAPSVQLVLAMRKAAREQRHRNGMRLMIGGWCKQPPCEFNVGFVSLFSKSVSISQSAHLTLFHTSSECDDFFL